MRLVWSVTARSELKQAVAHIAEDDLAAAIRVRDRISDTANTLTTYPSIGRPGRLAGTRELVIPHLPYLIVYLASKTQVVILRVLHTSRNWPK
ncbi:type II toxin-antitoxin system RelE/ParE family toxin [Maricaulis sp.]|uniref:type II toxin-antitoxin system RelE/ParE family toxin n=1 Tax=Maricaulis sp. TaxID=1486257 RepID=UPI003A8F4367